MNHRTENVRQYYSDMAEQTDRANLALEYYSEIATQQGTDLPPILSGQSFYLLDNPSSQLRIHSVDRGDGVEVIRRYNTVVESIGSFLVAGAPASIATANLDQALRVKHNKTMMTRLTKSMLVGRQPSTAYLQNISIRAVSPDEVTKYTLGRATRRDGEVMERPNKTYLVTSADVFLSGDRPKGSMATFTLISVNVEHNTPHVHGTPYSADLRDMAMKPEPWVPTGPILSFADLQLGL